MNNKTTTFEVIVDYLNLKQTSAYTELQKKIDDYNVRNGHKTGLSHVSFEIELDNESITQEAIEVEIAGRARAITGIVPYEDEIEDECAVSVVGIKDSNVIIELIGTDEAQESSSFSDPGFIYRGFVNTKDSDYEDYECGKLVKKGSFTLD